MQTPKNSSKSNSSETPKRVSPRASRQLKLPALECGTAASSNKPARTPKDRSPKVLDRRSPRAPTSEKKRPGRVAELESQISQLQGDLKIARDHLNSSELWKKQAQQAAEESKKQFSALSLKLEESQRQLLEKSLSEEQQICQEHDSAGRFELEVALNKHPFRFAALTSALNEIHQLKVLLELTAGSGAAQAKHAESSAGDLQTLNANLAEALSLVENMKKQLKDSKESEARVKSLVSETLQQLGTAKKIVEVLRSDGMKAVEVYNSVVLELDKSRARVNLLEELVSKLDAELVKASSYHFHNPAADTNSERETGENQKIKESEFYYLKSEVEQLRSALDTAETKHHEVQIQSAAQIRAAYELIEQIKSDSSLAEAELKKELRQSKADIEELKADLMDKETELQGISEENEGLHLKLKSLSSQRECQLEKEVKELKEGLADLKTKFIDKDAELRSVSEENVMLKLELDKRKMTKGKGTEVILDLDAARSAEKEALVKLGIAMEEAEKSNKKAAKAAEQLEAAQTAYAGVEAELGRLRVQCDQWRKAAEAATAMLSAGNNGKLMDRCGSLDSNYTPDVGKFTPYGKDISDDLVKKKHANVLNRIGVLLKRQQK